MQQIYTFRIPIDGVGALATDVKLLPTLDAARDRAREISRARKGTPVDIHAAGARVDTIQDIHTGR